MSDALSLERSDKCLTSTFFARANNKIHDILLIDTLVTDEIKKPLRLSICRRWKLLTYYSVVPRTEIDSVYHSTTSVNK